MAIINEEWGRCISDLLSRHNLTSRGARLKAGGNPSHTTIRDWCNGVVPKDKDLAYQFLALFPRDEAIQCLRAANIPAPPAWTAEARTLVDNVRFALRAEADLSDDDKAEVLRVVQEIIERKRRERLQE